MCAWMRGEIAWRAQRARLPVQVLHAVVAVALARAHAQVGRVERHHRQAQPGVQPGHGAGGVGGQVLEAHHEHVLEHLQRQVGQRVQPDQRRADRLVLGEQHVGAAEAVEVGKVVGEVDEDRLLVLRLDRAVDLPQLAHADHQPGGGLDLQQQLDAVQPRAVLVDHRAHRLPVVPAAQEAAHGGAQVAVAEVEIGVQLRQEEAVVADHAAQAQQHVGERRAVALAADVRVLGQQLAQQRGAGAGEAGDADELREHGERALVETGGDHATAAAHGGGVRTSPRHRGRRRCLRQRRGAMARRVLTPPVAARRREDLRTTSRPTPTRAGSCPAPSAPWPNRATRRRRAR